MTEVHPHGINGKIIHWIHHGGYPVLFALLLLCGLGLPLPEDIPLITAGVLVQKGEFRLAFAAFFAWCGIIGGDCMLYYLGRKFGADVTKIPFIGRHINVQRMARVEKWFDHYGVWVVAGGRMFAGIRGAMVVVAGATKFNFWKFVIADGLAAIVSGGLFIFIGYKFAKHWDQLEHVVRQIKGGMLIALTVVTIAVGSYLIYRWHAGRDRPGFDVIPVDPPAPEAK